MLAEAYYKAKSVVRPITRQRKLLERAKYLGTRILSPQEGNDLLARLIHQPAAIGKIGASEMGALRHHWRHADSRGHCESWGRHAMLLYRNAGVYPPSAVFFSRFCRVFVEALTHLDGSLVAPAGSARKIPGRVCHSSRRRDTNPARREG
jgi:hypothetical protein